jgi:hypothetical protein
MAAMIIPVMLRIKHIANNHPKNVTEVKQVYSLE